MDAKRARIDNAQTFIRSYQEDAGEAICTERLRDAYHILMHDRIGTPWPMMNHYFSNNPHMRLMFEPLPHILKTLTYSVDNYTKNKYYLIW